LDGSRSALQAAALFNIALETTNSTALIDPSSLQVRHIRLVPATE
jgi:hypothetical protein